MELRIRAGRLLSWMLAVSVLLTAAAGSGAESLEQFAQACDALIPSTVTDFDCDAGTDVPATHMNGASCDRPDQLNQDCDPGSKFQVLADTTSAVVVAHCRKRSESAGRFGDIAVIQHNKTTGATCFYQGALQNDHSGKVKAPSKGVGSPKFWLAPAEIAGSGFPCVRCHDNGPIIRSPYLSQVMGPNGTRLLPGAMDTSANRNQPYSFVGESFADWKAFKVEVAGNLCNGCHRMGVNTKSAGATGTAIDLGIRATAMSNQNKNPHSAASPMWMLPGETSFDQSHADAASAIAACAKRFTVGGPLPDQPDCRITQFAGPAQPPPPPPNDKPVSCFVFDDGYANRAGPSQAIYFAKDGSACIPDGTAQGTCRKWFGQCRSDADAQAVTFRVFDDGNASVSKASDAVYARQASFDCIPDGTGTGTCRKWFGLGETADRHAVACYVFNDGLTNWMGPTQAIYYAGPSKACMPDGTGTGSCRKWFGNCQVGAALPPLPPAIKNMNVQVAPYPLAVGRTVSFRVLTTDPVTGAPVAATIQVDGRTIGSANSTAPISFKFVGHRVGTGTNAHIVYPAGRAVPAQPNLYRTAPIDFGFPDF